MNRFPATSAQSLTLFVALFSGLLLVSPLTPAAESLRTITITMGDYTFKPETITVQAGETVRLEFSNTDNITPHNFILKEESAGLNVDLDVSAQQTKGVDITPTAPGRYTFYCDKKLLFLKSHRERGMEGTLIVAPGPKYALPD